LLLRHHSALVKSPGSRGLPQTSHKEQKLAAVATGGTTIVRGNPSLTNRFGGPTTFVGACILSLRRALRRDDFGKAVFQLQKSF
jgi:hypothetical protein